MPMPSLHREWTQVIQDRHKDVFRTHVDDK